VPVSTRTSLAPTAPIHTDIELRKLTKLFRHPVEFYLEESLRAFPRKQDEEDEYLLNALQKHILTKKALHAPVEVDITIPLFRKLATAQIESEVEKQREMLQQLGVERLFTIHRSPLCRTPHLLPDGGWLLPPLVTKNARFIGTLEEVAEKGLLIRGEESLEAIIRAWPLYLVYLHGPHTPQMLFLKDGKTLALEVEDPAAALEKVAAYYIQAHLHPSPLLPACAEALLFGSSRDLEKALRKAQNNFFRTDETLSLLPSADELYAKWSTPLREAFEPLILSYRGTV